MLKFIGLFQRFHTKIPFIKGFSYDIFLLCRKRQFLVNIYSLFVILWLELSNVSFLALDMNNLLTYVFTINHMIKSTRKTDIQLQAMIAFCFFRYLLDLKKIILTVKTRLGSETRARIGSLSSLVKLLTNFPIFSSQTVKVSSNLIVV